MRWQSWIKDFESQKKVIDGDVDPPKYGYVGQREREAERFSPSCNSRPVVRRLVVKTARAPGPIRSSGPQTRPRLDALPLQYHTTTGLCCNQVREGIYSSSVKASIFGIAKFRSPEEC